jgi:hypothetical protein
MAIRLAARLRPDARPNIVNGMLGKIPRSVITFPTPTGSSDTPSSPPTFKKREEAETTDAYRLSAICAQWKNPGVPVKRSGCLSIIPKGSSVSGLIPRVTDLFNLGVGRGKVNLPSVARGVAVEAQRFDVGKTVACLVNSQVAVTVTCISGQKYGASGLFSPPM